MLKIRSPIFKHSTLIKFINKRVLDTSMRATIDLHASILNPSVFRSRSVGGSTTPPHVNTHPLPHTHTPTNSINASLRLDTTLFRMVLSSWTEISISYTERERKCVFHNCDNTLSLGLNSSVYILSIWINNSDIDSRVRTFWLHQISHTHLPHQQAEQTGSGMRNQYLHQRSLPKRKIHTNVSLYLHVFYF